MYIVLVLWVLSFLTIGAWRILQQKNSMQQVVALEYRAVRRHELCTAGAAYALAFYKARVHGLPFNSHVVLDPSLRARLRRAGQGDRLGGDQNSSYAVETVYHGCRFVCVYTAISAEGAQLALTVYERQKNLGTYQYHIMVKAGKVWCTPA